MLQHLESQGWSIKADAYQELVNEADGNAASVLRDIANQDLKKIGKAALPDDINRVSTTVKGPVVLQISSITDVSRPSTRESSAGGGADRLLCLRLSDGRVTCKALEYQRVDALSEELPPGTKVLLSNASVKNGVVLLGPKNIKVLGGRVELLAEAWETQRRYGGVERPKANGPGDDGEMAPPFRHFIPGRDDKAPKLSGRTAASAPRSPQTIPAAVAAAGPSTTGGGYATNTTTAKAQQQGEAAAGVDGGKDNDGAAVRAPVAVVPAGPLFGVGAASEAAKRKLQEQLEARGEQSAAGRFGRFGGRGRGGGGFRRGRRGGGEDDGDDGAMTLEEWEAMKKAKAAAATAGPKVASQLEADEALARQLQAALDLEELHYSVPAESGARFGQRGYGGNGSGGGLGRDRDGNDYGYRAGGNGDGRGGRGRREDGEIGRSGLGGRGAGAAGGVGGWFAEADATSLQQPQRYGAANGAAGRDGFDRGGDSRGARGGDRGDFASRHVGGREAERADGRRGYDFGAGRSPFGGRADARGGKSGSDRPRPSSAQVLGPSTPSAAAADGATAIGRAAGGRPSTVDPDGGRRQPLRPPSDVGREGIGTKEEAIGRSRSGFTRSGGSGLDGRDDDDGRGGGGGRAGGLIEGETTWRAVSAGARDGSCTAVAGPSSEARPGAAEKLMERSKAAAIAAGPSGAAARAAAAALAALTRGLGAAMPPAAAASAAAAATTPPLLLSAKAPSFQAARRKQAQPSPPPPPAEARPQPPAHAAPPAQSGKELAASMFNFRTRPDQLYYNDEMDYDEVGGTAAGRGRGQRGRAGRGRGGGRH